MISLRRWWAFAAAVSLAAATRLPAQEQVTYLPGDASPAITDVNAAGTPAASTTKEGEDGCCSESECKPSWWQRWRGWWGGRRCQSSCGASCTSSCKTPHCQSLEVDHKGVRFGDSFLAHIRTQKANGYAARMVLYHCDFVEGTAQLNQRGKDQVAKIAMLANISAVYHNHFPPVIVERTTDAPGLDEARRKTVAELISRIDPQIAAERVVVGVPISVGLSGRESELVYQNLLNQTKAGGTSVALPAIGRGTGGATGATPR